MKIMLAAVAAALALTIAVCLAITGVLEDSDGGGLTSADESHTSLTPTNVLPTATNTLPTEPPNPFITDTGVLHSIIREFAPTDPNATYSPEAEDWPHVVCEADAGVYVDPSGRVTGIAEKGYQVTIEIGEQIVADRDFSDLPYMAIPVHREENGNLTTGYRQCLTESGEVVPTAAPEDHQ